jgi:hypothetical protein
MRKLAELKNHLKPGRVYRRQDLTRWSKAVDRDLQQLVEEGTLTKLAGGVYARLKDTVFGKAPAEDAEVVKAFLKDDDFLLASLNTYNGLGVGTTQLYNKTVVYNHKRHGAFSLGGRTFDFRMRPRFPRSLSKEFLLVDLVNNLDQLAESKEDVLMRVRDRAASYDATKLYRVALKYGKVRTKKFFADALNQQLHVA